MGASMTPGKVGNAVVTNLVEGKFEGEIVPVNPGGGEYLGQKFYTSLEEYGKPIECSVIAVPTKAVKGAVQSSLKAGAKAVVVITAGFKEVDEEGARLEAEIAAMCKQAGRPPHGPQLPGPHQHASQAERLVRQPYARGGRHLGAVAVGRPSRGHTRLGGRPQAGSGHPAQHRQQGRPGRDRLPLGLRRRRRRPR